MVQLPKPLMASLLENRMHLIIGIQVSDWACHARYFTNVLASHVIDGGQSTTMSSPSSIRRQNGNAPQ